MSLASEEHRCYYCGNHKNIILIPVCKECLDSFNKYMDEELDQKRDGNTDT